MRFLKIELYYYWKISLILLPLLLLLLLLFEETNTFILLPTATTTTTRSMLSSRISSSSTRQQRQLLLSTRKTRRISASTTKVMTTSSTLTTTMTTKLMAYSSSSLSLSSLSSWPLSSSSYSYSSSIRQPLLWRQQQQQQKQQYGRKGYYYYHEQQKQRMYLSTLCLSQQNAAASSMIDTIYNNITKDNDDDEAEEEEEDDDEQNFVYDDVPTLFNKSQSNNNKEKKKEEEEVSSSSKSTTKAKKKSTTKKEGVDEITTTTTSKKKTTKATKATKKAATKTKTTKTKATKQKRKQKSEEDNNSNNDNNNNNNDNNIKYPKLSWCKDFGTRSKEKTNKLKKLAKLSFGDDGYYNVTDIDNDIMNYNYNNNNIDGNDHEHNEQEQDYYDEDYDILDGCGITIVKSIDDAKIVLKSLYSDESKNILHAVDTEVMNINLKEEGPVGNGYVTCISIYSGPNFNYGLNSPNNGKPSRSGTILWIDNIDDSYGIIKEFKNWFEDDKYKKIWHNYGFDRHVLYNEGINVLGFGGDTMHMARLQDTSRSKSSTQKGKAGIGFSLEALTNQLLDGNNKRKKPMKEIFGIPKKRKDGTDGKIIDIPTIEILQRTPKFRKKFIIYSCYDAKSTWLLYYKLKNLLQNMSWIGISPTTGKETTLYDYYDIHMKEFGIVLTDMERRGIKVNTSYLKDITKKAQHDKKLAIKNFRNWCIKKLGPVGLLINPSSSIQLSTFLFGGSMNIKTKELTPSIRTFTIPFDDIDGGIDVWEEYNNAIKEEKQANDNNNNNNNNSQDEVTTTDLFDEMKADQLKKFCQYYNIPKSGKKEDLQIRLRGYAISQQQQQDEQEHLMNNNNDYDTWTKDDLRDTCIARGLNNKGTEKTLIKRLIDDDMYLLGLHAHEQRQQQRQQQTFNNNDNDNDNKLLRSSTSTSITSKLINDMINNAAKNNVEIMNIINDINEKKNQLPKKVDVTIKSLGMLKPNKYTVSGSPSATSDVIKKLAGNNPYNGEYGTAYEAMGGGDEGHEACVALYNLGQIGSIETMIANFLTSLQERADHQSRVHCSLNLNTDTGRLSSRQPNLQNQPALEKDKYRIRSAFESSPNNNLIVADYGQLELRLLASMTKCHSMIDAFKQGGDFHSRTAIDMFDYVREAVDDGRVILEWDYAQGDKPTKPLVKDEYASERRKAKTLNFSIAYGKTAHGLSQDWGVSREEAEKMLKAWYNARPEVERWQKSTKAYARKHGITRTLMGRYRQLPDAQSKERHLVSHGERAAINTPIQGGAADVAMMAMIKINKSEELKKLGWILLLQIHDEVILEGPEETAEEAFAIVVKCMEEPWVEGLQKTAVPLLVDGSCTHKNWYEAK